MGVSEGAMRNKDLQGTMRGGSWDGSSGGGEFAVVLGMRCSTLAPQLASSIARLRRGTTGRSGVSESRV